MARRHRLIVQAVDRIWVQPWSDVAIRLGGYLTRHGVSAKQIRLPDEHQQLMMPSGYQL